MKMILILLFTSLSFGQSGIVASGNKNYTIGSGLVYLQIQIVEETLGVPKYEIPKKPIVKKKSFIQKLMEFLKRLINKNK